MVDAMIYLAGISQIAKAIITVMAKEMGMALFAGIRNPTRRMAANRIGTKAKNARSVGDMVGRFGLLLFSRFIPELILF